MPAQPTSIVVDATEIAQWTRASAVAVSFQAGPRAERSQATAMFALR